MSQFAQTLAASLIAGALIFVLGLLWAMIPKSYRRFLLRRFWGKGVLGEDFVICYGALRDLRLEGDPEKRPRFRYRKHYHDGANYPVTGPFGHMVGAAAVRAASHLINALSAYRKAPVSFRDDWTEFGHLDRTVVAISGPTLNEMTKLILGEPSNTFLEFGQEEDADKGTFIVAKKTGERFVGFQEPIKRDYGVLLKIPNQRFPGHFLFVCAGLGDSGDSAAAWYLATKWRELQREFGEAFGLVLEVEIGSDESARRVFP